jgi:DNA-binding NtrC family response regulator
MRTTSRDCTEPLDLLIVDDEADARDLLEEFCVAQGFRVTLAADGRAALAAIERKSPAFPVVITDLHLPYADGLTVLESALRAHASCYVILVTGYATIDAAVKAVRAGAYDFLAKPFVLGQLELLLHRIRDRMALEVENRSLARRFDAEPPMPGASGALLDRLRVLEDRIASLERLVYDAPGRPAVKGVALPTVATAVSQLKR